VPVIAGTGSNSTEEAIALTRHAREQKAAAALIVTPYYNKPTQAGLYAHFKAIALAVDLPLIVYNIPGRSVVDMSVETMARLAKDCPSVVGVKDATADLTRPLATTQTLGPDFLQLSGEDGTALAFLASGGHGCISVAANVAPALCARLQDSWRDGAVAEAMRVNQRLYPLNRALFLETNPAPVKYAASLLGKSSPALRLPLVETQDATKRAVEGALRHAGLYN
jgi:4-hydroxy-tetrahydrodipicolinate synthase